MEGKRTILAESVGKATWLQRDGSDPEGMHDVVTQYFDNGVLAENDKMRQHAPMLKGKKMPFHDGAELQAWIRCPSAILWEDFLKTYPEIRAQLDSADESERQKAVLRVQLLHPRWVIMG